MIIVTIRRVIIIANILLNVETIAPGTLPLTLIFNLSFSATFKKITEEIMPNIKPSNIPFDPNQVVGIAESTIGVPMMKQLRATKATIIGFSCYLNFAILCSKCIKIHLKALL